MNIYHHHTIQLASACACCPSGRAPAGDAAPAQIEAPYARPSIFGALGDLVRFTVMRSLLHATTDRSGMQPSSDPQEETTPVRAATSASPDHGDKRVSRPTIASEVASSNPLLALFSQPAPDLEAVGTPLVAARADLSSSTGDVSGASTNAKPLSPLMAALLAAFRDEPPLA